MNASTTIAQTLTLGAAIALALSGCGESGGEAGRAHGPETNEHAESTHAHADGSTHADHAADDHAMEEDHAHDETSLGTASIGDMTIELAQGHGAVAAGKEGHLVVKLPYNDGGSTIVRAWIGTADRTLSYVGKGEYAPSHDDYDIHAIAPDPLPADAMWWIEIEKPDGAKVVGSAQPIL